MGLWKRGQLLVDYYPLHVPILLDGTHAEITESTDGANGRISISPPKAVPWYTFGPRPTHWIVARSRPSGWLDPPTDRLLTEDEIDRFIPLLRQHLRTHPDESVRECEAWVEDANYSAYEPIWFNQFYNGSYVVLPSFAIILGGPLLYITIRRHSRVRRNLCPHCAYDLSATPGPICPECGHDAPRHHTRTT